MTGGPTQVYGSRAMSVASDFIPEPPDQFYGDPNRLRATSCRTVTGKRKRDSVKKLVNWLLHSKEFRFQSLVGTSAVDAFRNGGSLRLSNYLALGTPSTYPQTVKYPVYIFRAGVPNGLQIDFPSNDVAVDSRPLIGYRLISTRDSAGVPAVYKWEVITPSQNCTQLAPPSNVDADIQGVVRQDDVQEFEAWKYRHDYTTASVLYSIPLNIQSTMVCGYVKFGRDDFCPPDEYVNRASVPPYNTIEAIRANSGAYNVAAATKPVPDNDAIQHMTDFWEKYITNREGHPLRRYIGNDKSTRNVFTWVKKPFVKVFTPFPTDAGVNAGMLNQHHHTDLLRGLGWLDTSISNKSAQLQQINQQNDQGDIAVAQSELKQVGIFPAPTEQRWFMVQAWCRSGTTLAEITNNQTCASFDVVMQQKFTVFTDPARRVA